MKDHLSWGGPYFKWPVIYHGELDDKYRFMNVLTIQPINTINILLAPSIHFILN